jgi:archaemetzincin
LDKKHILVVYQSFLDEESLNTLVKDIECVFGIDAVTKEVHIDLDQFFNPARRQYNADDLLKLMENHTNEDSLKTIGIFRVDLFIPILTFIFGQAIFKGDLAVVSTYRLRSEQYGLKEDKTLLLERLRKVVIHELGHTFGLVHCFVPSCVMRSSTYVEDLDQKERKVCADCEKKIIKWAGWM